LRLYAPALLLLAAVLCGHAQVEPIDGKIRVLLVGTFHFAQQDSTYDVLSPSRQKEVEELCGKIVAFRPDRIFIEQNPEFEHQNKRDSLYHEYLAGRFVLRKNEIYQVGFRVGKVLGHKHVYQCDHPGMYGLFYDVIEGYARKHDQMDILNCTAPGTTPSPASTVNEDSIMNNSTILSYIRWLNSKDIQASSHASYVTRFPRLGNTDVSPTEVDSTYFVGSKLLADWYRRNIMIYSKILVQLQPADKKVFLIIGNDHVPILRQLFEDNPFFVVEDTEKWLE
jgi:hypothetical protein